MEGKISILLFIFIYALKRQKTLFCMPESWEVQLFPVGKQKIWQVFALCSPQFLAPVCAHCSDPHLFYNCSNR